ncbi:MAG: DUF2946 family protein [Rhizobium sp.]|nr:MAG: DUF2946 family protein [Rhizobium sp.]
MEDWVYRALAKWPNVPAVFGWLGLDRRGRWLIRGEIISRPQIIDTINRNYAADKQGQWFFQNGPQRGYVELAYAPFLLRVDGSGKLRTHTELLVEKPREAFLDEDGAVCLSTEHGPGLIDARDLAWVIESLTADGSAVDEDKIAAAMELESGKSTGLQLDFAGTLISVTRLDSAELPGWLGFVRVPQA